MTEPELQAVLFDRDGTLVVDVPFNDDPQRVVPMPTAAAAVARARAAGLRVGVATNQPGIATGELPAPALRRVNARIDELLGPFDVWQICTHAKNAGCGCRKPEPGLITAAAREWGLRPEQLALIGDTAADMGAAAAAGARGILVPNAATRIEEVRRYETAATLDEAVRRLLAERESGAEREAGAGRRAGAEAEPETAGAAR
ncbi:HAD-IIIA family hydrolase [Gryllotalpicola ginsengisoli]|uniref:HAD-IIIA family hydrolase n=1 Tax=Gryllotalpicola ginsengisoli TaxID=444608 RepID=UPI0003F9ADB0|nr:HAD-IIIA family hydrolase [Gryllotalpicola ginsengisoli]